MSRFDLAIVRGGNAPSFLSMFGIPRSMIDTEADARTVQGTVSVKPPRATDLKDRLLPHTHTSSLNGTPSAMGHSNQNNSLQDPLTLSGGSVHAIPNISTRRASVHALASTLPPHAQSAPHSADRFTPSPDTQGHNRSQKSRLRTVTAPLVFIQTPSL